MIDRAEIEAKANEFEINPANVQRDYVFGWILFGIFTASDLKGGIFLKGGNALRKGYFENTRFSADLDFGTPGNVSEQLLMGEFNKVCLLIEAQAGVKFLPDEHKIKEKFSATDAAAPDLKVYEVRLYFKDFYGNADHIKIRISIDFTRYDKVLLPIQVVPLIHPYSDVASVNCNIRCMKLEEIIATKLKCILQRQHAPDLFDYVYSIKKLGGSLDRSELVRTFIRKTIFDRNPHVVKEILLNTPFAFFREYWAKGVVCAKQALIGVEEAIAVFTSDLADLFKIFPDNSFSEFAYFRAETRVPILEAGRSMTCLKITYGGHERLVEPYSLRYMQRRDGAEREYFYVYDRVGGNSGPGVKALVADKLTAIENTDEKFEPRFPVELSKAGEMTVLAAMETCLYYVRRDVATNLAIHNALPAYGTVPPVRWFVGSAVLIVVASLFCSMNKYLIQRQVAYRTQLITMTPSYSGITERPLGGRINKYHYWLFFAFPLVDIILWFYFRLTSSIVIPW